MKTQDEIKSNVSKCLLILNLQRPFVNKDLDSMLANYGKVDRFWIDNIKTHCYVEYSTPEEAKEAKINLNDLKWPAEGKKLNVDFFPESELNLIIEKNQSPYEKEKTLTPDKNIEIINENKNIDEPVKTLDNLFKKTETKPHLYYLPLSEEEVEIKRQKLKRLQEKN